MTLLLRSIAGSHLYGTSRPESDFDYYEVYSELPSFSGLYKTQQTIVNGVDITMVSLSHFMELARIGSHQALDAMFSEKVEVDKIEALRHNYRAGYSVVEAYARIIRKFAIDGTERKRKHAVRVTFNLIDILESGRFNPTLTAERKDLVLNLPKLSDKDFFEALREISPLVFE
jgi:hypothetical protein